MDDRGSNLGFDVVADDRHAGAPEAVGPVLLAGDEDGDAVDEAAAGLEHLLDVPLGRFLGADREVVDDDIDVAVLEDVCATSTVEPGALSMTWERYLPRPSWVMPRSTGDAEVGDIGELHGVVGLGEDGLGEIEADFARVDVEGGDEVEVGDGIAAEDGVHNAGDSRRRPGRSDSG